ncbi:Predicted dehydrogenase [Sanguibacter gelidistatuariae]|uniref:Predicted dehydrogenase n=1 Tax=Sanguibacter gelidistatuariae TaxID=1814289 RepID=A0A1G6UQ06_9MICO|nr:Gfo/Idh/MocA family oxidoreductase [Sanguibacter gelidistatuariae]SDD43510.1 Predicted dehydrogenase [Sanguibacter gelidistatuariae]
MSDSARPTLPFDPYATYASAPADAPTAAAPWPAIGHDRPIRVAIIGTGSVAHLHAQAIALDPLAVTVACAERIAERLTAFADTYDIPGRYETFAELLAGEDVDVVHLCTPPDAHREQTLQAVAAGVHVVCEKPPALSLAELDDMQQACDDAGLAFAIVFQQRTGTGAAHVRALLTSGALGRPLIAQCETLWYRGAGYYAVDWRGRWSTEGGGTTLGHGIHQIDLLAHLLGDWAEISAQTWRLDRATTMEDASTATILFANGVVATATSSTLCPRETSHVRIDCEKATIEVEHLYGHAGPDWRITAAPIVDAAEAATWAFPGHDEPSGHVPLIRETYRSLREGTVLPDVASSARRPLEIVTAIYASADAGGRRITATELREQALLATSLESAVRDPRVELGLSVSASV